MKTKWVYPSTKKVKSNNIDGVSDMVISLLRNRGITDEDDVYDFLNPDLNMLYDPFLLKDMNESIVKIKKAINTNKRIFIYGDHDVDGCTSVSILLRLFKDKLKYNVDYYIPNRLNEGYGLSTTALDILSMLGCELLITVDCGITAKVEVEYAKQLGIEVIITDHHKSQDDLLPDCLIVNPNQKDCHYPNKGLAGCGVAFKLACALYPNLLFEKDYEDYLNIVAFGSIADVVPLTGENRIIAYYGCRNMGNTNVVGLRKLIKLSNIEDLTITSGQVGYTLAPKINAINRVGKSELAIDLLTTNNEKTAETIAEQLNVENEKRKEIEKDIIECAVNYIETNINLQETKILVIPLFDKHTGVLGIASSKICEQYYRPTIIVSVDENGNCKGSARSISGFSIFDALKTCDELLGKWGGHSVAAGLSFSFDNFKELTKRLNNYASYLTEDDLTKKIKIDQIVDDINSITFKTISDLKLLEPHGVGNPKPNIMFNELEIANKSIIGKLKNHAKAKLSGVDTLFFNTTLEDLENGDVVNIIADLDINSFRGVDSIQLIAKDWSKYDTIQKIYR